MVRFYLLDLKQMRITASFYTKPVDIKTSLAKNFATSQLRNFATSQLRNFATSKLRNFATSQLSNNSVFKKNYIIHDAREISTCVFLFNLMIFLCVGLKPVL